MEPFKFRLNSKTLVAIDWANVHGWFKDLGWEVDPKRLFDHLSTYPEIFDIRLYQGIEIGDKRSENFGAEVSSIGFNFITKEVKFVPVSLEKSDFKKIVKNLFDVLDTIQITNTEISNKLFEIRDKIKKRLEETEPDIESDGNGGSVVIGKHPAYHAKDETIYNDIYDLIEELDSELKKLNLNISNLQTSLLLPIMRRKCDFDVEIARDVFNMSNDFEHLILFSGDGDYAALVDDLIKKGKNIILVFGKGHKGKEYNTQKGLFMCSVEKLKNEICKRISPQISPGGVI